MIASVLLYDIFVFEFFGGGIFKDVVSCVFSVFAMFLFPTRIIAEKMHLELKQWGLSSGCQRSQ